MQDPDRGSDRGYETFVRDVCEVKGNRLLFPVITTRNGQEFTYRQAVQKGLEVLTLLPWKRRLLELRYYLGGSDYPRDPSLPFKLRPLEEIRKISDYENIGSRDIREALDRIRQSGVFTLFQGFIAPTYSEIGNLRAEKERVQRELLRLEGEVQEKDEECRTLSEECKRLRAQTDQLERGKGEALDQVRSLLHENEVLKEKLSRTQEELARAYAELKKLRGSSVLQFIRMKLQRGRAASS